MTIFSKPIARVRIDPKSGAALTIKRGQILRVVDVEGQQVADLMCFAAHDLEESLSSGHTTDYNGKLFLSTGDALYSNRSNQDPTQNVTTETGYPQGEP